MKPGLHHGIPMADYLALDALGSGRLEWLKVSPLHYRYMLSQPRIETDATRIGTAVHLAALEPALFPQLCVAEPDPEQIAPGMAKPRATRAYRDAVAQIEANGRQVLRTEAMEAVLGMALAVRSHRHAAAILRRAQEREVTAVWTRADGRACRARIDILGSGIAGDLKTTRSLADFCPREILRLGYWRQAGHYSAGLRELRQAIKLWFWIAVERAPPHDVGVFVLDAASLALAEQECDRLCELLAKCEGDNDWPGMFPDVVPAQLPDSLVDELSNAEAE